MNCFDYDLPCCSHAGSADCGLFAIAFALELAINSNVDVTKLRYEQSEMRTHLIACLKMDKLTPFPISQSQRRGDGKRRVCPKSAEAVTKRYRVNDDIVGAASAARLLDIDTSQDADSSINEEVKRSRSKRLRNLGVRRDLRQQTVNQTHKLKSRFDVSDMSD